MTSLTWLQRAGVCVIFTLTMFALMGIIPNPPTEAGVLLVMTLAYFSIISLFFAVACVMARCSRKYEDELCGIISRFTGGKDYRPPS